MAGNSSPGIEVHRFLAPTTKVVGAVHVHPDGLVVSAEANRLREKMRWGIGPIHLMRKSGSSPLILHNHDRKGPPYTFVDKATVRGRVKFEKPH